MTQHDPFEHLNDITEGLTSPSDPDWQSFTLSQMVTGLRRFLASHPLQRPTILATLSTTLNLEHAGLAETLMQPMEGMTPPPPGVVPHEPSDLIYPEVDAQLCDCAPEEIRHRLLVVFWQVRPDGNVPVWCFVMRLGSATPEGLADVRLMLRGWWDKRMIQESGIEMDLHGFTGYTLREDHPIGHFVR